MGEFYLITNQFYFLYQELISNQEVATQEVLNTEEHVCFNFPFKENSILCHM